MISFYPGPSRLHPSIPLYFQEACDSGILSVNHRSAEFIEVYKSMSQLFKDKLKVPEAYSVMVASSATECWEILAQSLVTKGSVHIYNGAFGEKWYEYAKNINKETQGYSFSLETVLNCEDFAISQEAEMIALTQSETSNGTALNNTTIRDIQQRFPKALIAVDATSSMGGVLLDFTSADCWFASVQKCFGMPAGMAVLVCSPKAIERARQLKEDRHYNSLVQMIDKEALHQTTFTPNVLSIYLLKRILEISPFIDEIDARIRKQANEWYSFAGTLKGIELLIRNENVRSGTVIAMEGSKEIIQQVKKEAKSESLLLGNGYGNWKETTFRIANFPSIEVSEIEKLKDFLTRFSLKF